MSNKEKQQNTYMVKWTFSNDDQAQAALYASQLFFAMGMVGHVAYDSKRNIYVLLHPMSAESPAQAAEMIRDSIGADLRRVCQRRGWMVDLTLHVVAISEYLRRLEDVVDDPEGRLVFALMQVPNMGMTAELLMQGLLDADESGDNDDSRGPERDESEE